MNDTTASPPPTQTAETPPAILHPCPRCGKDRGAESRILCSACWSEAPASLRHRWINAISNHQRQHPAALALLAWARPGDAPPKRPRPERPKVRCGGCKELGREPSRRALAELLLEILPTGTPKKVRERAELVARRLRGLCEACAAAPPAANPREGALMDAQAELAAEICPKCKRPKATPRDVIRWLSRRMDTRAPASMGWTMLAFCPMRKRCRAGSC